MIKENPNLYYTTPVYHMPIDDTGSAVEYIEAERTVVPDTTQQIIEVNAQHLVGQVVVEPIPNEYVNVLDATAEENSQVADGYIAYGKNGVRLVGTMTPSGSAIDFSDLDYTDEAVPGYYVSAVNETDGIIEVSREALPEIPEVPTNISSFTNDAGYIDPTSLPTRGVAAGFSTSADIGTLQGEIDDIVSTIENLDLTISEEDKADIIAEVEASIEPPVMDETTKAEIIAQVTEGLDIPDSTSDLINDSGFITSADLPEVPTKVSDLTNDLHFIGADSDIEELVFDGTYNKVTNKAATESTVSDAIAALDIPDSTSDLTNDSGFATTTYVDEAIAAIPSGGGSAVNPTTTREQDSGIGGYILYSGYSATRENDSLFKTRDFSVSNVGTTTTLYIGNATDGSQNQVGTVALQGAADQTASYYNTVNTATLSRNVINTLPASSGTILTSATTSVTPVLNSGTKIATIKVNNVDTDIFAPEGSANITKVSELTNDAGYITANDVPSVGIMAIPITYDANTETYVSPFTTLNISRFDFPIVSYENRYYYLDSIDDTDSLMTFINPQYLVYHIADRDLGDGYIYGFTIGASYDSLTGNPIEVITPLLHAGNPSV